MTTSRGSAFTRRQGVHFQPSLTLLALAATIWHNWKINARVKRSLIAYDP
jgi:hypothetical protein